MSQSKKGHPEVAAGGDRLEAILRAQKAAQLRDGPPDAALRTDRIDRAIALLVDHAGAIETALSEDFGHRSADQTRLTDIVGSIAALKYARKNLRSWMRPRRREVEFPMGLLGARAELRYQPKGVVGIISPWNFPVRLAFAPMAGALAAGNRIMLKPSEFTPATSELLARLVHGAFDETEIAVVTGGPELGEAFSRLAFDHLLFTGSTSVGRHVMRAAADNLVPVTLELGGKSPVILGESARLDRVASSVGMGKMLNAGQICLAPDYVLAPKGMVEPLVKALESAVSTMYPTLKANPDYTSIINRRHFDRLQGYLAEARAAGARLVEINPAREDFSQQPAHKMPLTLVIDPPEELKLMQDELFGPILPIRSVASVEAAIDFVNARPRPLALYYFGEDEAERERVLARTLSGGACVNEAMLHESMDDLPFGGIGASGMGVYHGPEGFETFSHGRPVFTQSRIDITKMLRPPYTDSFRKIVGMRIKK